MVTVNGSLKDILGAAVTGGSLVVQLCGFGSQQPRVSGTAVLATTAPVAIVPSSSGTYNFTLYGNDKITPAGTFYVVQFLDAQNNVVQVAAYQLTDGTTVDLSSAAQYAPAPAFGPLGPYIVVTFSATAAFAAPAAGVVVFEITLTGNVTAPTLTGLMAGQLVTFVIIQDGVGGRTFAWPGNVNGGQVPNVVAGAMSTQSFVARPNGQLYPLGPMEYV